MRGFLLEHFREKWQSSPTIVKKTIIIAGIFITLLLLTVGGAINVVHAQGSTNIVVESVPHSSLARQLLQRVIDTWPWYVSRAAGLIAGAALVILLLSGIGSVTGHFFRFLEPLTAWATHRALGIVFLVAVLVHITALYFDTFVPFGLKDLFVPFASDYQPLYVALGIGAFYLAAAVVLSSLLWVEKKPRAWKLIHLLSYPVMLLVFLHALYVGTDLSSGFLRYLWIALFVMVILGSSARLWRAWTT